MWGRFIGWLRQTGLAFFNLSHDNTKAMGKFKDLFLLVAKRVIELTEQIILECNPRFQRFNFLIDTVNHQ
jgi:hypothetical protein